MDSEGGSAAFNLLAKALDMSAPTLSKHLAKLEEGQYVATRRDSADSRRQWALRELTA